MFLLIHRPPHVLTALQKGAGFSETIAKILLERFKTMKTVKRIVVTGSYVRFDLSFQRFINNQ